MDIYIPQFRRCCSSIVTPQNNNKVTRSPEISPPTGSEASTTIFVLYILDIDSHCPYLLSGETTFQLTSC